MSIMRKQQTGELSGPGTGVSGGQFTAHTGGETNVDVDLAPQDVDVDDAAKQFNSDLAGQVRLRFNDPKDPSLQVMSSSVASWMAGWRPRQQHWDALGETFADDRVRDSIIAAIEPGSAERLEPVMRMLHAQADLTLDDEHARSNIYQTLAIHQLASNGDEEAAFKLMDRAYETDPHNQDARVAAMYMMRNHGEGWGMVGSLRHVDY